MKTILVMFMLFMPVTSMAATATWTLHYQEAELVENGVHKYICEYKLGDKKYLRVFENYCEAKIEIIWE